MNVVRAELLDAMLGASRGTTASLSYSVPETQSLALQLGSIHESQAVPPSAQSTGQSPHPGEAMPPLPLPCFLLWVSLLCTRRGLAASSVPGLCSRAVSEAPVSCECGHSARFCG